MFTSKPVFSKFWRLISRIILVVVPVSVVVLLLSLTVFAKNTYYINDGDRVLVHMTYATDPAEILNEAGVELDSGDTYTTQTVPGASEITVQRRQTVTIVRDGVASQVYSYGETLDDLLNRLDLNLTSQEVVSYPLSTLTYHGMTVTIGKGETAQENYIVQLPFETVYCQDPTLPEGEEVVLVAGVNGLMACTDLVSYVDGREFSRTVLTQTVTHQPVNAVIAVGTAVEQPGESGLLTTHTGEVVRYLRAYNFKATAYSKHDPGCDDYTATGTKVRYGVVAVDPKVIPLGSELYIVTNDGVYIYGYAVAEDTGGAIKENRIDLYFDTVEECLRFGRRECTVYLLSQG
ncbi:MAG: G5 domain-containing protein [Oscillospiraceae bacterium]|nr:G5 domain-containing protein [Oscillospiraceae bacterium]